MSFGTRRMWLAGALLLGLWLALGARHLETPGLYYDEAIQAVPAASFLRAGGEALHVPGARSTWLADGWFPLWTQPYMGALKSQLLIPVFSLFGSGLATLRLTTLVWGGLALLAVMGWVRRVYGPGVALCTAVLLACDPSFFWVSRHDWGSVALALVLRALGLWGVAAGWQRGSPLALGAGGLMLGLGVTNKVDAAVFVAGAALAWLGVCGTEGREALRRRSGALAALGAGLLLGAAPALWMLPELVSAAGTLSGDRESGGLAAKLLTWRTWLDGSHFERLMLAGGDFDRVAEHGEAARTAFAPLLLAALVGLALRARGRATRGGPGERFACAALVLTALGLLLLPAATRIHHVLNLLPLPQLVVALAARRLWQTGALAPRSLAAAGLALACLGGLRVDRSVAQTLAASGGSGRWAGALVEFARTLPADAHVVSLDWGFHNQLRLLRPELSLKEPIWRFQAARRSRTLKLSGRSETVYLVWAPGFEVFSHGGQLLRQVARLAPDIGRVEVHRDGLGRPAFRSVRIARAHDLVYRGAVEVRLR